MIQNNNIKPVLVFWELTKHCNLKCKHCRAEALNKDFAGELDTGQVKKIIADITSYVKPLFVFTGGEPLFRRDLFEIIHYADTRGAGSALATNGVMIDDRIALQIKKSAIKRVSISLDGADEKTHDEFRGVRGAFKGALRAAALLEKYNIEFQFNTTITRSNITRIAEIIKVAEKMQAAALHLFMLVPVGCGIKLARNEEITKEQYEELLKEVYVLSLKSKIEIKTTCAPHYQRVIREHAKNNGELNDESKHRFKRGCLAATGICFISSKGDLQACGYLPLKAGNLLENTFEKLWKETPFLNKIRDVKNIKGKCKACKYIKFCSGCRARAYYAYNDYLEEEPYCLYIP